MASGLSGYLLTGCVLAGCLLAVLMLGSCSTADAAAVKAAPRISDTSFEAAARSACSRTKTIFDTASTLPKEPTNGQSADLLDTIDRTFASLLSELRQLPVAARDQSAVSRWLDDWDSYVSFGRTYAAALRTGSERDLVRNQKTPQGRLRRRLQAFAVANHMAVCRFQ
jgi:hypothetical protein